MDVPRYIDFIKDGRPDESLGVILEKYPLASSCSRVCVRPCEAACTRGAIDQPVAIRALKRHAADQPETRGDAGVGGAGRGQVVDQQPHSAGQPQGRGRRGDEEQTSPGGVALVAGQIGGQGAQGPDVAAAGPTLGGFAQILRHGGAGAGPSFDRDLGGQITHGN